jgi:hypothetical protein
MTHKYIYIGVINADRVLLDNMGIAAKIIFMPCVVIEMLTKTVISVMVTVICLSSIKYWSEIQTNGLI